jgi:hypothetical protein
VTDRPTVLVCDDDARRVNQWADRIRELPPVADVFEVVPITPEQFGLAFAELKNRKLRSRNPALAETSPDDDDAAAAGKQVDAAALLIVDYDLTPDRDRVRQVGDSTTLGHLNGESGENFVYLVRAFSAARGVVIVNQRYQEPVFDLTLQKFAHSYADVNVTHRDLDNPALWNGEETHYRPWSWPRLTDLPDLVARRRALVDDLDRPVLEALGLADDMHFHSLAQAQLDPLGDDPTEATFRTLAREPALGLNGKDTTADFDDPALRRIAASAVARWLEWFVVPAQNVLVDLPHLVQRRPSLVEGDATSAEVLDKTTDADHTTTAVSQFVFEEGAVPASAWTSTGVWSWPKISAAVSGRLPVSESHQKVFVFCEDSSRFVEIEKAHAYDSDVPGPYRQRFVEQVEGIDYQPRNRLLLS